MSDPTPQRPESPAPQPRGVQYVYPPPGYAGAAARPSFFGTILRIGGAILLALFLILLGFYFALTSFQMGEMIVPSVYRAGLGDKIAIIPITGIIAEHTSDYAHAVVESILEDDSIKAVVLRVESPGGGATASDQILHELGRLQSDRKLPIIASYGGYAASGGYYVSCQADKIFAEPTTVTGSIGVISQIPTVQELLRDKLGVKMETITASEAPLKELANTYYRDWTEEDRAVMRKLVDAVHKRFVTVVYEGRQTVMTAEQVAQAARGQVFTAEEAKAVGLVDDIGYLDAALVEATTAGGFTDDKPPVVIYHPRVGFLDLFGYVGASRAQARAPRQTLDAGTVRGWLDELSVPRMMMLFEP